MAENVEGNVRFTIDASQALATLRGLQKQLAIFHSSMAQAGAGSSAEALKLKQNLLNSVNATGAFSASMVKVKSSTEAFTHALENNKMSMGEYFRYAGGATKSFGKMFKTEFSQIQQVAESRVKTLQTRFISMGRDANGALQAIKIRPLTLDMKDLTTQQMIAAQKQQLFNQLIKQGSTQMLNWGKNTQWAGRQLMVGFTIPITMFASAAAKAYMEIEKQTIAFKRVYGDFSTTQQQTDAMAESIKNLAQEFTQYGVAIADTMDLAAKSAAMGKVGADLSAQVKETTRLAVLGQVDQQQALDTTISLTNAFGVSADQLAGKIDFLNAVENQTVTSISDLTEAIPKAGPVVQQLGGNVEDLTFFLTAMREGGINAAEGANALKSGLAAIINPTGKAAEMLQKFGINIQGIVNANKGDVKGLVIDFAKALDQLDPLNRAQAIEQLFGKFQFSRISTLFQNVIKEGSQAQQVLKLTNASSAELAALSKRELSKLSESPVYKFEKAITDFQTALAPIGEQFLKAVTPLIQFGTDLLKKFDEMGEGAKQVGIYIAAGLGVVGPVFLMITGLVANGIANLIKFGSAISNTFMKFKSGTKDAAFSTEYLTQAQLNELAATADLDAAHSKLKATLTSETSAMNALAASYERAIAAQKQMAAFNPKTGTYMPAKGKAKKYASGVVSVPGPKGAGDVVPAMLSPGEAIIPVKETKKYFPLIQGIVADNIPGYATSNIDKDFSHLGPGRQVSGKEVLSMKGLMLPPHVMAAIRELVRVVPSAVVNLKNAWGAAMSSSTNRALGKSTGADISAVGKEFTGKNITSRYGEMTKIAGADIADPQLQKELVAYDKAMSTKIAALRKAGVKRIVDTEAQLNMLPESQRKVTRSLESLDNEVINEIGKENKNLVAVRKKAVATVRDVRIGEGLSQAEKKKILADKKASSLLSRRISSSGEARRVWKSSQSKTTGGFGIMTMETPKPTTKTAKPKGTPQTEKAITAGSITTAQARQVETRIDKNGNPYYTLNGKRIPNAAGEAAVAKVAQADSRNAAARTARANRPTPAEAAPMTRGQKFAAGVKGMGSRIAGGIRGMGPMGGMLAMGAAGTGIAMIPGMEGIGTAVASIGPMLMMLPAPIAIAVGALGALGIGVFSAIDTINKANEAGKNIANAMTMTGEKLQSISEFTGTMSATEARKVNQEALIAGPQSNRQLAFGESFLQSDQGKAMIADIATQRGAGLGSGDIAKNIGTQLSAVVAQGVLTPQQAQSIAINLGKELKDYKMSTDIQANLTKIIGPNGENLATDPLRVTMEITKSTNEQAQKAGQAAVSGQVNPVTPKAMAYGGIAATGAVVAGALAPSAVALATAGGTALATGWTGVGLVAAAGIAIGALALSVGEMVNVQAQNTKLAAQAAQSYANAYQQNIGMADVINKQYDARIAEKKANLEAAQTDAQRRDIQKEIDVLEGNRTFALQTQRAEGRKLVEDLIGMKDQLGNATFTDALKGNLKNIYKDDKAGLALAQSSLESINALSANTQTEKTFQTTLQLQLVSGELDPLTAQSILAAATSDKTFTTKYNAMVSTVGDAKSIQMLQLLGAVDANAKTINTVVNTIVQNPDQVDSYMAAISTLRNIEATGGVTIDINTTAGQQQLKNTAELIDKFNKEKEITIDVIQRVTGSKAIATALKNNKDFMKLPKNQKIAYAATYTATMNLEGDPSMQTAYKNWQSTQPTGADVSFPSFARYIAGTQVTSTSSDTSATTPADTSTTSGGGGGTGEDKKLARLNKQLDKRQKALAVIQLLEDKINKRYDERAKALQKIAEINNKVAQAQRDQLSIANALATGDIAAAAMAVQDARENAAAKAAQDQTDALEAARKRELDAVTFAGQNRKSLEEEISRLELLVAKREYQLSGKPTGSGGGSGSGTKTDPNKNNGKTSGAIATGAAKNATIDTSTKATFKYQGYVKTGGGYMNPDTGAKISTTVFDEAKKKFEDGLNSASKAFDTIKNGAGLTEQALNALSPSFDKNLTYLSKTMGANTLLGENQNALADRLKSLGYKVEDGKVLIQTAAGQVKIPLANVAGYLNDLKSNATPAAKGVSYMAQATWDAANAVGKSKGPRPPTLMANGGLVPSYFATGGYAVGTDTVPAMLTPGEFVVSRPAVRNFGVDNLKAINNNGSVGTGSVYNYSVTVNAQTGANADQIASTVLAKIKQVESQRIKGNRY